MPLPDSSIRPDTLRPWTSITRFRYPFVKPRIPPLDKVAPFFKQALEASYFSNFGPASRALEKSIEQDLPGPLAAIACVNCTAGLTAALIAKRIKGPVLIPAFTFAATASAVAAAGLRAVIGDVDGVTGVLSSAAVRQAAQGLECAAAIVVRPYGIWSDLSEVSEACRDAGLALIIDNAAGLGITPKVMNDFCVPDAIEVFSLHATKPFGVGEGGMIVAPASIEDDLRSALNFGLWPSSSLRPGEGINGKMDELTASMAGAVLVDLSQRVSERQAFARIYSRFVEEHGAMRAFVASGDEHLAAWQCFPILLTGEVSVHEIVKKCEERGLQARRYYHPVIAGDRDTPNAAALSEHAICLPVYDGKDSEQVGDIINIFSEAVSICS
jgi:dTDP-4-amino-4,6-dideoxygalactose transaminase